MSVARSERAFHIDDCTAEGGLILYVAIRAFVSPACVAHPWHGLVVMLCQCCCWHLSWWQIEPHLRTADLAGFCNLWNWLHRLRNAGETAV